MPTDGEAEAAYQALVARESPWPEWHQSNLVSLPAGLRFQMAIAPGQPTDRPGGFGTFDRILERRVRPPRAGGEDGLEAGDRPRRHL